MSQKGTVDLRRLFLHVEAVVGLLADQDISYYRVAHQDMAGAGLCRDASDELAVELRRLGWEPRVHHTNVVTDLHMVPWYPGTDNEESRAGVFEHCVCLVIIGDWLWVIDLTAGQFDGNGFKAPFPYIFPLRQERP